MTLAPTAPPWPARVITVASRPLDIARGRPREFRQRGVVLDGTSSIAAALVEIGRDPGSLVLVPSNLGGMPLLDFIEVVRAFSAQRVIIGVAGDCDVAALATALEQGLATSVALPVTPAMLAAAVELARPQPAPVPPTLRVGALELDLAAFRVFWHGADVRLTPRLVEVLHYFVAAYPRVISMEELVSEFGSKDGLREGTERARVSIGRMRHLFAEAHPEALQPFETVHRVGYRLSERGVPIPSPR